MDGIIISTALYRCVKIQLCSRCKLENIVTSFAIEIVSCSASSHHICTSTSINSILAGAAGYSVSTAKRIYQSSVSTAYRNSVIGTSIGSSIHLHAFSNTTNNRCYLNIVGFICDVQKLATVSITLSYSECTYSSSCYLISGSPSNAISKRRNSIACVGVKRHGIAVGISSGKLKSSISCTTPLDNWSTALHNESGVSVLSGTISSRVVDVSRKCISYCVSQCLQCKGWYHHYSRVAIYGSYIGRTIKSDPS